MNNWLRSWKLWRRKRRARKDAEMLERRRAAIRAQIAHRRAGRREWKSKQAEFVAATTAALNAERWL